MYYVSGQIWWCRRAIIDPSVMADNTHVKKQYHNLQDCYPSINTWSTGVILNCSSDWAVGSRGNPHTAFMIPFPAFWALHHIFLFRAIRIPWHPTCAVNLKRLKIFIVWNSTGFLIALCGQYNYGKIHVLGSLSLYSMGSAEVVS